MQKYSNQWYQRYTCKRYQTKSLLKKMAKVLVEDKSIKPTHAHEIIAKSWGYNTYNAFLASLK